MWSFLSIMSLSLISRWVVVMRYSLSHTSLVWTFLHVWRQAKEICSQGIFVLFWVVHNWCCCNKPPHCQVLVCKLLLFICRVYVYIFKQLLSLPSYPFGSINHFCYQSERPSINTCKKAMLRSWRLTLLLTLCTLVIKILSHYSIGRWLTLMVCVLSIHALFINNLWQGETVWYPGSDVLSCITILNNFQTSSIALCPQVWSTQIFLRWAKDIITTIL